MLFVEQSCVGNPLNTPVIRHALMTIKSWGGGSGTDLGISIAVLGASFGHLYGLLFDLMSTPLIEFASDSLVALLENSPQLSSQVEVFGDLAKRVLELQPCYERGLADGDTEKCKNYLRIVVAMCSTTAEAILNGGAGASGVALLETLLAGMQHPELAVAEQALDFWSDVLPQSAQDCSSLHPSMQHPLHGRLVNAVIQRAALPVHFTGWQPGDNSADLDEGEWGLFRLRLRDVLRHCCKVLSSGILDACRGPLVCESRQHCFFYPVPFLMLGCRSLYPAQLLLAASTRLRPELQAQFGTLWRPLFLHTAQWQIICRGPQCTISRQQSLFSWNGC